MGVGDAETKVVLTLGPEFIRTTENRSQYCLIKWLQVKVGGRKLDCAREHGLNLPGIL